MSYPINVYIIEDNLSHAKYIKQTIEDFTTRNPYFTYQVNIITNYVEFFQELDTQLILANDLFIIDIHLHTYFSGLELAEKIRQKNQEVPLLFITSDDTKSSEVINKQIKPFGYIVKQTDPQMFFTEHLTGLLTTLEASLLEKLNKDATLSVRVGQQTLLLKLADIYYIASIKGERRKVHIVTSQKELICSGQLVDLKKEIAVPYFYTNLKSYLINLLHVQGFNRSEGLLFFDHQLELYVGTKVIDKLSKELKD